MEPPVKASTPSLSLLWNNELATQATAHTLATSNHLANALILLHGDLGAGKTTFVRYLLEALDIKSHVKSPTYAVVEPYDTSNFPIWHFDFYRFNDPLEWEDAGFRDIFAASGLKLVEWPEQAQDLLPKADLELFITRQYHDNEIRLFTAQANTSLGQSIINVFN